jgi:hypothetical protein
MNHLQNYFFIILYKSPVNLLYRLKSPKMLQFSHFFTLAMTMSKTGDGLQELNIK